MSSNLVVNVKAFDMECTREYGVLFGRPASANIVNGVSQRLTAAETITRDCSDVVEMRAALVLR